MGNGALQHVTKVQQRGDNSIVVYIQTGSFKPGQEVEVSAYLTQGSAYAFYNEKKRIPLPDPPDLDQPAVLHVELPKTELDAEQPVTVVTRVTEVWPTVLQKDSKTLTAYQEQLGEYADQGLKAAWKYQDPVQDSEGKAPGGQESPPSSTAGGVTTSQAQ